MALMLKAIFDRFKVEYPGVFLYQEKPKARSTGSILLRKTNQLTGLPEILLHLDECTRADEQEARKTVEIHMVGDNSTVYRLLSVLEKEAVLFDSTLPVGDCCAVNAIYAKKPVLATFHKIVKDYPPIYRAGRTYHYGADFLPPEDCPEFTAYCRQRAERRDAMEARERSIEEAQGHVEADKEEEERAKSASQRREEAIIAAKKQLDDLEKEKQAEIEAKQARERRQSDLQALLQQRQTDTQREEDMAASANRTIDELNGEAGPDRRNTEAIPSPILRLDSQNRLNITPPSLVNDRPNVQPATPHKRTRQSRAEARFKRARLASRIASAPPILRHSTPQPQSGEIRFFPPSPGQPSASASTRQRVRVNTRQLMQDASQDDGAFGIKKEVVRVENLREKIRHQIIGDEQYVSGEQRMTPIDRYSLAPQALVEDELQDREIPRIPVKGLTRGQQKELGKAILRTDHWLQMDVCNQKMTNFLNQACNKLDLNNMTERIFKDCILVITDVIKNNTKAADLPEMASLDLNRLQGKIPVDTNEMAEKLFGAPADVAVLSYIVMDEFARSVRLLRDVPWYILKKSVTLKYLKSIYIHASQVDSVFWVEAPPENGRKMAHPLFVEWFKDVYQFACEELKQSDMNGGKKLKALVDRKDLEAMWNAYEIPEPTEIMNIPDEVAPRPDPNAG